MPSEDHAQIRRGTADGPRRCNTTARDPGRPGHGRAECPPEVVWIEYPVALAAEPVSGQVREKAKLREQAEGTRSHVQSARMGKDRASSGATRARSSDRRSSLRRSCAQDEGGLAVPARPATRTLRPSIATTPAWMARMLAVESHDRPGDDGAQQSTERLVVVLPASGLALGIRDRRGAIGRPGEGNLHGRSGAQRQVGIQFRNQLYEPRKPGERMASSFESASTTTSTPWIRYPAAAVRRRCSPVSPRMGEPDGSGAEQAHRPESFERPPDIVRDRVRRPPVQVRAERVSSSS